MSKAEKRAQQELEELVKRALAEAGVAEAVEVYEKAEAAYARLSTTNRPVTYAADSTDARLPA